MMYPCLRALRLHQPITCMVIAITCATLWSFPNAAEAERGSDAVKGGQRVKRFAFVLGVNAGGMGRPALRYATRDAEMVANVLAQLGAIAREDLIVQRGATVSAFEAAWQRLSDKLRVAQVQGFRVEVLFYFSGHSDEQGLLLRGERISYERVRRLIAAAPADVRVAVLDSCASGALTLGKGGVRGAPFLLDEATRVRGHAFVTSASADEIAQESERLRGSFFTHHFVAGLRGAADANQDRRVTLNEAYQYAFNETLAQTESTRSGAQHANYDMHLVGSGSLVLTDLHTPSAMLVFSAKLRGQIYVRDADGHLVAELRKSSPRRLALALDPGRYHVRVGTKTGLSEGTHTVRQGETAVVSAGTLHEATTVAYRAKGAVDANADEEPTHIIMASYTGIAGSTSESVYDDPVYMRLYPYRFMSKSSFSYSHGADFRYLHRVGSLYVGGTFGYRNRQFTYQEQDSLVARIVSSRYQEESKSDELLALISAEWHAPVRRLQWGRWLWRWIRPLVGADFGVGWIKQSRSSMTFAPKFPSGTDTALSEEEVSERVYAFVGDGYNRYNRWSRSLTAVHARMRVGFAVPLYKGIRLETLGHLGFEISEAHADDRNERQETVANESMIIPQFGVSVGAGMAF